MQYLPLSKFASKSLLLIALVLGLSACGGEDASINATEAASSDIKTGVFLDSAVDGVKYKTSSGLEGYTNAKGEYHFKTGDTVEFLIGDVSLGETTATSMLTTDNFPFSIQVAQFLQTLDDDGIADNGIQIAPEFHNTPLFKKATSKADDASTFAKNLNIADFDASLKNAKFINSAVAETGISTREIVSESAAFVHKQKAEKLRRIKENNPEFYSYIDGSYDTDVSLPADSNIHNILASRLAYYFYSKVYEPELDLKVDLHFDAMRDVVTTQEDIEKFASTYLNIGGLATEIHTYTADFIAGESVDSLDMNMKRRITSAMRTSGRSEVVNYFFGETGRSIVGVVDNCLPMIKTSWPSLNGLTGDQFNNAIKLIFKEAGKSGTAVIDCAMGEVVETTGRFINTYKGNISVQEYEHFAIAKKYLDVYFSCGYLNNSCVSAKLGGKETMNEQLQHIMEVNQLDTGIDFSIRTGAKIIIGDYITTITDFTNEVTNSLPSDTFFNFQDGDKDTTTLDINIHPLKLANDEQGVLWVNIDVKNLSGRDIYLTSFTPKFVVNGEEFTVASDFYGDWETNLYDRSFSKTSSVNNIRIPISLNNNTLPETGIARLVLEVGYMSTDRVFSNTVQRVIDLDLAELWNSTKMEELDAKAVSLAKIIDTSDEKGKYYLPSVFLGDSVQVEINAITWEISSKSYTVGNISLGTDKGGHYVVLPALREGYNSDIAVLNAFVNTSLYSDAAIFVLNIAKLPVPEQEPILLEDGAIVTKWIDLPSFGSTTDTYMNVNAYANNSDYSGLYQCTELVKRFYKSVYKIERTRTGDGKDVALKYGGETGTYNNQSIIVDYHKNGLSKLRPENGSIVSFSRNDDIGHVAIVKKVECDTESSCTVTLFEQNWIWTSGNKISHSRTATFNKKGAYWSGYDNETKKNNVIGWTTVRLDGKNSLPVADAGVDKFVEQNTKVILDGSNSSDDGIITSYEWSQNNATISTSKVMVIPSLTTGDHTITLKVTDNFGETASDTINITVYDDTSDTDNDGMPDKWEVTNGMNPLQNDANADLDGDGYSNLQEYTAGTDPALAGSNPSVVIPDTTAPVITINGSNTISITQNSTYSDAGATAVDNVDGIISVPAPTGTVDTTTVGSYTLSYTAVDAAGNMATATRVVKVTASLITTSPNNVNGIAGDQQITVSWDTVVNADSYNVYIAEETGLTAANINVYTGGTEYTNVTSPYTVTGLMNDKPYYLVVTSVNSSAESVESSEISVTPKAALAVNLSAGLVAHYEFEGNANDSSGNGNNGVENGLISYSSGVVGKAVNFDGNYANYIRVPHHVDLNIKGDYSFTFWSNRSGDTGVSQAAFSKGRDCLNSYRSSWGTTFGFTYGNSWCDGKSVGKLLPINEWHHIAVIISNSENKAKYYIDGIFDSEVAMPSYLTTNTYDLVIGRHDTSNNGSSSWAYPYVGKLDDLRIYSRGISQSEITALYNQGNQQSQSLVFRDNFDGVALDGNKWRELRVSNANMVSVINGEAHFSSKTSADTCGILSIKGDSGVVIESSFAGQGIYRDTHIELIDVATGDRIQIGDTNYFSWGLYAYTYGMNGFTSSRQPATTGVTTSLFKEYRLSINGKSLLIERGDTLSTLNESLSLTLPNSIIGKTFYLRIGTAGPDYQPANFDYIRVRAALGITNTNCPPPGP